MKVTKRSGKLEELSFDKILKRIKNLCKENPKLHIDSSIVSQKVIQRIYDKISTKEIDELSAQISISSSTENLEYGLLASRIMISNNQKNNCNTFTECIKKLKKFNDNLVDDNIFQFILGNYEYFDGIVDHNRDYNYDYFGFKTLEKSYLSKVDGETSETPQYLVLRVSIGIHFNVSTPKNMLLEKIKETYDMMSNGLFTHATPTLFNAGSKRPQMASCFLLSTEDSAKGIYKTISDCAIISKWAGGIGVNIQDIRAKGSVIKGTNGKSDGIVPMLKVYNATARYMNQGSKRKGSFSFYIEPWHSDILDFLDLKKNTGAEEIRARDLFYAMWIPDLFMKCVENDDDWYLMTPDVCTGLTEAVGDDFVELYYKYVSLGKWMTKIKARDVWNKILESQIETGTPYLAYKDSANLKSNQKNLGTIKSSNLCCEIYQYSSPTEYGVCNLASIALPKFITNDTYDLDGLMKCASIVTYNLNRVIDHGFYPLPETSLSNFRHRPIGVGVQGLADTFFKLRLPFDSDGARELNLKIFEAIYFGCLRASCDLARTEGAYETFKGSPFSKGLFQFDLWDRGDIIKNSQFDWEQLRNDIKEFGVRNSLLTAVMPTASTSQILGNFECIEPLQSNIFTRTTLGGEFIVINKYLVSDLIKLKLWNTELKDLIIYNQGSIQNIQSIPGDIKELYKTTWEISQKTLINLSADRALFIDQSQSLNLFIEKPTISKLTSMHFYAFKKGLKTGCYYLRSKAAKNAVQFTIEPKMETCPIDCESCSG